MSNAIPAPENPIHILIAEDSPTQAQRLQYTLERHGYKVTPSVNGRQAIEFARLHKPAVIISDVLMPEMDGYQLCEHIKSEVELKNIPVILVTTLADPQDVIRALECGADNFVVKPYEEHYLLSRIQSVLLNYGVRGRDTDSKGVEIYFNGERHVITANRLQILNLLLSTYDAAMQRNQELARAKDELRGANSSLEAANKELEAFSYSVSHDLRARLRAIDGFSHSILEKYAEPLGEDGKDLLQRVLNSCKRMGQLIEDLLNLSRMARTEMHAEQVDLSALATLILGELQKNQPERTVGLSVADGLSVEGDARLLRVALENLLGNAWKFTSKGANAIIEVGTKREGKEKIFFVRDNGAGFNMSYAKKLFAPFQRLHSTDEFPGTGIGLTIVQRIVHRHGGRIWVEAEEGKGATFYFTL